MKRAELVSATLLIAVASGAAFIAGRHWQGNTGERKPTSGLGIPLACEASALEGSIAVASLLDNNQVGLARDVLISHIRSSVTKLKSFEPYAAKNERAMVSDSLKDGDAYLSTHGSR
ncbi:hypothetical protein [Luteibacter sp. UNC138MFCol5.1]|uniref:hypothetical protein n=1 Tax=Luteibacter sp. UNC138MFCol5.1 TaxID=1502774 RepID=UPI0011608048|nr:hypothetical protein [Luteibacter sp. UNC138MFCol5.1]